jgi:hypothetical protein
MELWKSFDELISASSIDSSKEIIAKTIDPELASAFSSFDFRAVTKQMHDWFVKLIQDAPPPGSIRALHFGMCEIIDGCELYVAGSNVFDVEDPEWACRTDWAPEGRYAKIDAFSDLWKAIMDKTDEDDAWQVALAVAIVSLSEFLRLTDIRILLKHRELKFSTGFDDGDLYILKI